MICQNCKHTIEYYKVGDEQVLLHFGCVVYCQITPCTCNKPIGKLIFVDE